MFVIQIHGESKQRNGKEKRIELSIKKLCLPRSPAHSGFKNEKNIYFIKQVFTEHDSVAESFHPGGGMVAARATALIST